MVVSSVQLQLLKQFFTTKYILTKLDKIGH